jgi:HD-like signal output (HDOD) protein
VTTGIFQFTKSIRDFNDAVVVSGVLLAPDIILAVKQFREQCEKNTVPDPCTPETGGSSPKCGA